MNQMKSETALDDRANAVLARWVHAVSVGGVGGGCYVASPVWDRSRRWTLALIGRQPRHLLIPTIHRYHCAVSSPDQPVVFAFISAEGWVTKYSFILIKLRLFCSSYQVYFFLLKAYCKITIVIHDCEDRRVYEANFNSCVTNRRSQRR